jgi:DNA-binding MarR family transcriptional regulator
MPPFATLAQTEELAQLRLGDMPLDASAMHAVASLHRAANAARTHVTNVVLRNHDLSWTGFVVLWSVWIYDGLPSWQAAQSASISKATLTGVVQTLESRGWLTRSVDPSDRRLVNLTLTPEGRELMEQIFPEVNRMEHEIMGALDADATAALTESLRGIVRHIETMDALS